jgi:hypothetical protein
MSTWCEGSRRRGGSQWGGGMNSPASERWREEGKVLWERLLRADATGVNELRLDTPQVCILVLS